jgi:hypothetical protein
MSVSEYKSLSISTESWFCKNCILPIFTDSYFEMNNTMTSDRESNTPEVDYVPLTSFSYFEKSTILTTWPPVP